MSDIKLTLMVESINKLVNHITTTEQTEVPAKDITGHIVGTVIGSLVKLPTAKPSNAKVFYTTEVMPIVLTLINQIVENTILNVEAVSESAYTAWKVRYDLVYPSIFTVKPLFKYLETCTEANPCCALVNNEQYGNALTEAVNNFANYLDTLEVK